MSQKMKPSRVQVSVDVYDRALAEDVTINRFGLTLPSFLRLLVKLIAQEKLDLSVIAKDVESHS